MNALHDMRFGAQVLDSGGVRFALWAPGCAQVAVVRVGSDGNVYVLTDEDDGQLLRLLPPASK